MRLFRSLTLLLTLVAPSAFADDLYQVEMILVRQNAVPAIVSRAAPEDWQADYHFKADETDGSDPDA